MAIQFGTDGWRAVISEDFTFENVRHVAQAVADTVHAAGDVNGHERPSLVVGYDTRFLSDRYAAAVAEVLAANGIHVWLTQVDAATPIVSHAIVDRQAQGGIMVTASHNPPRYNGLKLKAAYGGGALPEATRQVGERIRANLAHGVVPRRMDFDQALAQGLVTRFDPFPAYRRHIYQLVDMDAIRRAGLTVAVDAMHGAGRVYLRRLLEEADCRVTELRADLNPGFNGVHPEPIPRNLHPLSAEMSTGRHRLGLATDGDADRIGAMDPGGRFIDPHQIMALLLAYLVEDRGQRGSVVKTVSTTRMLNRLADHYGLPIHETPVGFNYITEHILQGDVLIGGEESGGITIRGHIPEGDGILMGMLLAELVAVRGASLGEQVDALMARPEVGRHCYGRIDRRVRPFSKADLVRALVAQAPTHLEGRAVVAVDDRDGVKFVREDESWLLIRPSGTEPVLRVYAEAHTPEEVDALLQAGVSMGSLVGQP